MTVHSRGHPERPKGCIGQELVMISFASQADQGYVIEPAHTLSEQRSCDIHNLPTHHYERK